MSLFKREEKRNRNSSMLDRETSRHLISWTKSSSQERLRSKRRESSSSSKRKSMQRTWRSRPRFRVKRWKKLLSQVQCKKRERRNNICKSRNKLKREKESLRNSKGCRWLKRKELSKKSKRREDLSVRTMRDRWKSTSMSLLRSYSQKNKTLLRFRSKKNIKCSTNTTMMWLKWLTRKKMWRESWRFKSMKGRNWWTRLIKKCTKLTTSKGRGNNCCNSGKSWKNKYKSKREIWWKNYRRSSKANLTRMSFSKVWQRSLLRQ